MMHLGGFKVPSPRAAMEVALQTVRQQIPAKPAPPQRQNVRFARQSESKNFIFH